MIKSGIFPPMRRLAKRKLLLVQSEEFGSLSWGVMLLDFMVFHLTEHLQLLCLGCDETVAAAEVLVRFPKLQWVLEAQPFCLLS